MVKSGLEDLIMIHPPSQEDLVCPCCDTTNKVEGTLVFQGIHTLHTFLCSACGKKIFNTIPTGHDLLFPTSFDETGSCVKADGDANSWLVRPLIEGVVQNKRNEVKIEKEIFEVRREVIILNCLDNCFGHAFSKLWNASILKEKYPEKLLIVFVSKSMRWLVPDNIGEVWSFDVSGSILKKFFTNLDHEVKKNLLTRFEKVWLSKAYTHLNLNKVDLGSMLRTNRFQLENFSKLPTRLTFILREDRFWHRHPFEYFLFKVFVKLKLSKRLFMWRQNQLINKTAHRVNKELNAISFFAAGLGRTGKLSSLINDQRKINLTPADEKDWCQLYSTSQIVVGIHGSNMLIPTALSAGFIEILPRDKIRHIAEDTLIDRSSRYTLFLGRHVDHFSSPEIIAKHAISMVRNFSYIYRNTEELTDYG